MTTTELESVRRTYETAQIAFDFNSHVIAGIVARGSTVPPREIDRYLESKAKANAALDAYLEALSHV